MSVLDRIEAEQFAECEAGPWRFRLRRINSATLRDNRTLLLSIAVPSAEDIVAEQAAGELPEEDQAQRMAELRRARVVRRLEEPETMARAQDVQAAVVRAAVVAVWDEEAAEGAGAWEAVTLVPAGEPLDRSTTPPRLPEDYLPQDARDALYVAAWGHSAGQGGEAARLASFRRGA